MHQFCEALRRLHVRASDQAIFINEEGNVQIKVTAADVGRGWHAVMVRLEQSTEDPFAHTIDQMWLTLPGFGTDQSFLPGFVNRISQFLRDWDIPIQHPMIQAEQ